MFSPYEKSVLFVLAVTQNQIPNPYLRTKTSHNLHIKFLISHFYPIYILQALIFSILLHLEVFFKLLQIPCVIRRDKI